MASKRRKSWNTSPIWVTAVPEGTSPAKVDEFRAAEAVRALPSSPKQVIDSALSPFLQLLLAIMFLISSKENL
jgi:hypothetical protein